MRADDEAAFVAFVTARTPALFRFACLLTGNAADADDLLQAALIGLAMKWPGSIADPYAYVRQSLVNLANSRWRALSRRARHDRETYPAAIADHADRVVESDELLDALRQLTRRQRVVVVLRYVDGLSERETADALGCSVGTVKSHGSRGLAALRGLLRPSPIPATRETQP